MNDPGGYTLPRSRVIGLDISTGPFALHVQAITALARERRSSYVCCVNAHMTVEAWKDPAFAEIVNAADLATADGVPVLKSLRWFHHQPQERVAGNDLMPALMSSAEQQGLSIYLFGGEERTLDAIVERAHREHPSLRIAGRWSPPFGSWTEADMANAAVRIEDNGAQIVLVSLGCPKQERWMAAQKGRVNAVMVGLGGAFLLYAGVDTRAPRWMRDAGLEWAFRLWLEPGRLWKRYAVTNTIFIALFLKESLRRLLPTGSTRVS